MEHYQPVVDDTTIIIISRVQGNERRLWDSIYIRLDDNAYLLSYLFTHLFVVTT